jgi:tetratricopeptide (TPR) repeat protein
MPCYRRRRIAAAVVLIGVIAGGVVLVRSWPRPSPDSPEPELESTANDEYSSAMTLARADAEKKEYRSALDHADRAIALHPENVDAYLLKSELLFRLHRSDEMIPWLQQAIKLAPARFEAHANLAYALRYAGRLDDAEREVHWCLKRRPKFVPALRILAEIHRDRGDLKQAMAELKRALEIDPHDLDAGLLESNLLLHQRNYQAAYDRLVPLLQRHPRNRRVLAAIERAARLTNRPDEASRYRERLTMPRPAN